MRNIPKQYLSKYANKNDVEKHSNGVLASYPGLNVNVEKFYFSDGSSRDLICLKGTIPIKFRGVSYNIPVSVHLPEHYPQKAPIVYVAPTSSMAVKPSKTVDPNGLVKLPYLANWNSRTHSLLQAVQAMVHDFSNVPPLYAKSSHPQAQAQHPPHGTPPATGTQPPGGGYHPPPMQPGQYVPYSGTPVPTGPYNQQPPTHPNMYGPPTTNMPPYPVGGLDIRRPSMDPPSYSGPYNPPPNPTPVPGYPPPPTANLPAYMPPHYSQPQPPNAQPYGTSPSNTNSLVSSSSLPIDPIKASLLTAITENLSRRIQGAQEMAQKDLDKLQSVQTQLKSHRDQLERTAGELERQVAVAGDHVALLGEKKRDVEAAIGEVQLRGEVSDIDDCISPSCPLYKQLLNLYAEECAIEDTTYYLDKALMDSVVDLETYLKNVRGLSRKQFMVRAQMQKARQTAGLRNITPH